VETKVLIIGYGNIYCRDDGVAFYIINALRRHQGLPELGPEEDGYDDLGHPMDTLMLHQLVPETVSVIVGYQRVIFVDAHLGVIPDDVRVVTVQEEYGFHAVSHHMSPGMVLAAARKSTGRPLPAYLVSVKGENFEFGLGLSNPCKDRADQAAERILELTRTSLDRICG
jgi:hydrogenase maturation protease